MFESLPQPNPPLCFSPPGATGPIYFEEKNVRGDGNCGFTALGVTRQQVVNVLLSLSTNRDDRAFLAPEILNELRKPLNDISDALKTPAYLNILNTREQRQAEETKLMRKFKGQYPQVEPLQLDVQKMIRWLDKNKTQEEVKKLRKANIAVLHQETRLETHSETQEVYESYVKEFNREQWLGYKSALLYAKQQSISLYILRRDSVNPNILVCEPGYSHVSTSARNILYLLYTGGFTHFNLLVQTMVPQPMLHREIYPPPNFTGEEKDEGDDYFSLPPPPPIHRENRQPPVMQNVESFNKDVLNEEVEEIEGEDDDDCKGKIPPPPREIFSTTVNIGNFFGASVKSGMERDEDDDDDEAIADQHLGKNDIWENHLKTMHNLAEQYLLNFEVIKGYKRNLLNMPKLSGTIESDSSNVFYAFMLWSLRSFTDKGRDRGAMYPKHAGGGSSIECADTVRLQILGETVLECFSIKGHYGFNIKTSEIGSYKDIIKKMKQIINDMKPSLRPQGKNKSLAKIIRYILHGDKKGLYKERENFPKDLKLSFLCNFTFLWFGTEVRRNVGLLFINQMLLDLIIDGKINWEEAIHLMPTSPSGSLTGSRELAKEFGSTITIPGNVKNQSQKHQLTKRLVDRECDVIQMWLENIGEKPKNLEVLIRKNVERWLDPKKEVLFLPCFNKAHFQGNLYPVFDNYAELGINFHIFILDRSMLIEKESLEMQMTDKERALFYKLEDILNILCAQYGFTINALEASGGYRVTFNNAHEVEYFNGIMVKAVNVQWRHDKLRYNRREDMDNPNKSFNFYSALDGFNRGRSDRSAVLDFLVKQHLVNNKSSSKISGSIREFITSEQMIYVQQNIRLDHEGFQHASFTGITDLLLVNCELRPMIFDKIIDIAVLEGIFLLDIGGNKLTGKDIENFIKKLLARATQLENLFILRLDQSHKIKVTESLFHQFQKLINRCPNLKSLNLYNFDMSDTQANILFTRMIEGKNYAWFFCHNRIYNTQRLSLAAFFAGLSQPEESEELAKKNNGNESITGKKRKADCLDDSDEENAAERPSKRIRR